MPPPPSGVTLQAIQTGIVRIRANQVRGKGHGALRLLRTFTGVAWSDWLPIYAWVIKHPEGLFVVDTGETARVAEPGYFPAWHPYFRRGLQERVKPEEEIGPQLEHRRIDPHQVRWVVLTHLHTDHVGGLHHFPHSEILTTRASTLSHPGCEGGCGATCRIACRAGCGHGSSISRRSPSDPSSKASRSRRPVTSSSCRRRATRWATSP